MTVTASEACPMCRAGMHRLCDASGYEDALLSDTGCCCGGRFDLVRESHRLDLAEAQRRGQLVGAETAAGALYLLEFGPEKESHGERSPATPAARSDPTAEDAPTVPSAGDSGYIDPAAWVSPADIGTLTDPRSTGRKRAARMYPITPGTVCEWARLQDCGGGPEPILGCMGNPATDWHHGPDKNTLNNAKKSRSIGSSENLHLVCSDCHNLWHARNDPYYPAYDRVADQDKPWLPYSAQPWGPQTPSAASPEALWEQEQRRERSRAERGREHRGRNAVGKPGDTDVHDDDDEP